MSHPPSGNGGRPEAGHACVVQLVSTGGALLERRLADVPAAEWDDLSVDLTPREYVLDYLAHAFPVQRMDPFTDESGRLMSRAVITACRGTREVCRG